VPYKATQFTNQVRQAQRTLEREHNRQRHTVHQAEREMELRVAAAEHQAAVPVNAGNHRFDSRNRQANEAYNWGIEAA